MAQAIRDGMAGLSVYPSTKGDPALRRAISAWLARRYSIPAPDAETQVLPALGSREALFAFTQTVIDPSAGAVVVCPNPFYQIYEGATLLAGGTPFTSMPTRRAISAATGTRCRKTSGARRGWCSSARQATRPAT